MQLYLDQNPEILDHIVKPSMTFYYSNGINLVIKLHEEGLLTEPYRKIFVDYIGHFTVAGDDLFLLSDPRLQTVFTNLELQEVKEKVKTELMPQLASVRTKREQEFRKYNDDSADEHMEEFFDKINVLLEEFEGDQIIIEAI